MPLPLKHTLSESACDQYDEDHARYTRMRILMKDGAYKDEIQILRANRDPELLARINELEDENRELKARLHELEDELDFIINTEMDDVAKLKEDVKDYYKQACKSELAVMEMEEVVSKLRAGKCDPGYVPRKTTQESDIGAL
ncbi:hypothetical protein C8R42DRAFT_718836 [Lentinula raphanica]|nr:hypothetical protein C8R42DRAFT_718836 [Lentinula raphanica]